MALGIEPNNLAPALIQSSGAALVQGIRQIGQQVSGHLTEMQTKRDLAALGQEALALNVESNEFPTQLAQLVTRHPLAARDERGLMALSAMGKAHGQWQATEAEARAFNRAMAMQGARQRAAFTQAEAEEEWRRNRPTNVPGVGLVQPNEIDPLTGQPKLLLPAAPRASAGPRVLSPGAVMVDPTGKKLAENPKPVTASLSDARMRKKNNMDLLMRQDAQTQREIGEAIKRLDDIQKQDLELGKDENVPGGAKKEFLVTTAKAIQAEVKALRDRREQLRKKIEEIESLPVDEVLVPPGAVVPPVAGANVRRVPMLDPNGVPMQLREDQVDAAIQNGWKLR